MKYSLIIILVFLSHCLFAQTNLDSLELLVDKKEGIEKVNLLNKISYKYWNISPSKGIEFGELGLKEAISNDYQKGKANSYNNIGVNYWAKGDFEIALSFYYKSLEIGEELNDDNLTSACINNIAMIYSRLKQYDKAIELYKSAEQIAVSLENVHDQIKYNNNIGNVFMRMGKYEEASLYFSPNLELSKQLDDSYLIALSYQNLGLTYYRQGNLEEAIIYFIEAFDMFLDISNLTYASDASRHIGSIYTKQQKYPQALKFLTKAKKFATESQSLELLSLIENDLAAYYVAIDDYKTAFLYQGKYQVSKDSLFNKNKTRQIAEMNTKYETEKKETENVLLRKDLELQTVMRNSFIALSILVILLVIILYSRFRLKQKANRELSIKNEQIRTHEKQLMHNNEILSKQYEKVNLLNATKDKFFTIISHDLKSPFNSILGFTNLLVEDYDNFGDTQKRKILNSLSKSSQLAYELLENLLTWARTQTGQIEINKERLNLKELVETSIAPYKYNASKKNIEIATNVPPDTKLSIDRNTSMTFIGNLVNNAIKFTPEGGSITINYHENEDNIELHIIDTGVGMTSEVIGKLFKIDEDISTKGTNNEKGTGLGLILCKEFINKNGGDISVRSEVGKGSDFIITLSK
jgi:signal transduction histidine kinase